MIVNFFLSSLAEDESLEEDQFETTVSPVDSKVPDVIRYYVITCNSNQECIGLRTCPYTKGLLATVLSSSNREEKNNLISEMRKLVCDLSTRAVCCDLQQ